MNPARYRLLTVRRDDSAVLAMMVSPYRDWAAAISHTRWYLLCAHISPTVEVVLALDESEEP